MSRFKKGQKVVCVRQNAPWICSHGKCKGMTLMFGPKFNEIVTVGDPAIEPGYVRIIEYPHGVLKGRHAEFNERLFEPLAEISELTEILEQKPQMV